MTKSRRRIQKGFDILENEALLVPNGAMTDSPAPAGLGESPSEITSGYTENGDGTQTHTYDISFRIDRYEVGAAMETFDGSQPDSAVVDQMAQTFQSESRRCWPERLSLELIPACRVTCST